MLIENDILSSKNKAYQFGQLLGDYTYKTKPLLAKRHYKIICDLDGVINNYPHRLNELMNCYRNLYEPTLPKFELKKYHIHKIHEKAAQYAYDHVNNPYNNFQDTLTPLPGAIKRLEDLRDMDHEIIICTSPGVTIRNKDLFKNKYEWIEKYLPWIKDKYIFTTQKDSINGDIFIDDSPENLERSQIPINITIDYPYNRDIDVRFRAYDYKDTEKAWNAIYNYICIMSNVTFN